MREVLKTSISKYGPKTNSGITVENVQGKGLQLVVIYAGRKHYLPLSSVPLNPDTHANHPNHQKIKVNHDGKVGIGTANPAGLLEISSSTADEPNIIIENTSTSQQSGGDIEFRTADTDTDLGDNIVLGEILWQGLNISHSPDEYQTAARITVRKDGATGSADDMGGELAFYTTADGSSDSSTQRMCILNNGNVGIGSSAPDVPLHVEVPDSDSLQYALKLETLGDGNGSAAVGMGFTTAATAYHKGGIAFLKTAGYGTGDMYFLNDSVGDTNSAALADVCMIIKGGDGVSTAGHVGIGTTTPTQMLNVKVSNGNDNVFVAKFENADADNPNGIHIHYTGVDLTGDDTADHGYLRCVDSNNTVCEIYGDGDIVNADASYTSDIRIKKDISNATDKLDDLVKLKVRNYKFKKPDGGDIAGKLGGKRIGFIADELETVFPDLIVKRKQKKFGIDYDDLKTIRGSALVPILVKAVQELSDKVTALESK